MNNESYHEADPNGIDFCVARVRVKEEHIEACRQWVDDNQNSIQYGYLKFNHYSKGAFLVYSSMDGLQEIPYREMFIVLKNAAHFLEDKKVVWRSNGIGVAWKIQNGIFYQGSIHVSWEDGVVEPVLTIGGEL